MNGIENSRADARLFDTSRFARQIEKVLASGINGKAPVITLSSGYDMPMVGLGTYSLHGRVCINSICTAIQNGYRLIDTASFYGNEKEVGEGIRRSGIRREEIFVTTKLYPNQYGYAGKAIDEALKKLDVGYIDARVIIGLS